MSLVEDSALLRFDQHGIRPPYPKKAKRLITIVDSGRDDRDSRVSPEIELQNQADVYTSDSDCENSTFEIDSDGYSNSDCESEGYKRKQHATESAKRCRTSEYTTPKRKASSKRPRTSGYTTPKGKPSSSIEELKECLFEVRGVMKTLCKKVEKNERTLKELQDAYSG